MPIDEYVNTDIVAGRKADKNKFGDAVIHTETFEVDASAATDGDIHRLFKLPGTFIPTKCTIMTDALTSASDNDLGVYYPGNGGAAVDADCLMDGQTLATASRTRDGLQTVDIAKIGQQSLAEIAGLTGDAKYQDLDVALTINTKSTADGTVTVILEGVDVQDYPTTRKPPLLVWGAFWEWGGQLTQGRFMVSDVQVCNLALDRLGARNITSLSDNTQTARLCNANIEAQKEVVLQKGKFSFARTRIELPQLVTTPAFGFSYQYQKPSDYLAMYKINDEVCGVEAKIKFDIEGDKILTDEATMKVVYIRKVTDITQWSALAREALSFKIAHVLAFKLTGSRTKEQDMLGDYLRTMTNAEGSDSQESPEEKVEYSGWNASRNNNNSDYYSSGRNRF